MGDPSLAAFLEARRKPLEGALHRSADALAAIVSPSLGAAVRAGVLSGGKRLRPILLVVAYEEVGALPAGPLYDLAASVELIHAYSLVHDDLPCRGRCAAQAWEPHGPHRHGVQIATTAGALLIPWAANQAYTASLALGRSEGQARDIAAHLLEAAGAGGMIGGQVLDLLGEGKSLDEGELADLHALKTGPCWRHRSRWGRWRRARRRNCSWRWGSSAGTSDWPFRSPMTCSTPPRPPMSSGSALLMRRCASRLCRAPGRRRGPLPCPGTLWPVRWRRSMRLGWPHPGCDSLPASLSSADDDERAFSSHRDRGARARGAGPDPYGPERDHRGGPRIRCHRGGGTGACRSGPGSGYHRRGERRHRPPGLSGGRRHAAEGGSLDLRPRNSGPGHQSREPGVPHRGVGRGDRSRLRQVLGGRYAIEERRTLEAEVRSPEGEVRDAYRSSTISWCTTPAPPRCSGSISG